GNMIFQPLEQAAARENPRFCSSALEDIFLLRVGLKGKLFHCLGRRIGAAVVLWVLRRGHPFPQKEHPRMEKGRRPFFQQEDFSHKRKFHKR
ncbi:MAG: hypothetical protein C0P66_012330, partial [Bacillaceae bacterium]